MHDVILSLASNRQQEQNLQEVRRRLGQILSDCFYSREIWTDPINSPRTDRYLNQLCQATTALSFDELTQALKTIEHDLGRTAADRQTGIVKADVDVLLFDGKRYHERDWDRIYVTSLIGDLKKNA